MNITYCYTREEGKYNVLLYAKAIRRHAHCFKRKQKPPYRKIFKSQKPKAITISYIGGWAAAKALQRQEQKQRLVFSKAIFANAKAAKAPKALLSKASKASKARQKPQKPKAHGCITYNYICRGARACTRIIFIIYNIYIIIGLAGYNRWAYFITVAGATSGRREKFFEKTLDNGGGGGVQ